MFECMVLKMCFLDVLVTRGRIIVKDFFNFIIILSGTSSWQRAGQIYFLSQVLKGLNAEPSPKRYSWGPRSHSRTFPLVSLVRDLLNAESSPERY